MDDFSRTLAYSATTVAARRAILGKVLFLLGVSFLCTAGGAFVGIALGPGSIILSLVGTIGTLIALFFLKEKSPLNLWLMYAFATFMGMSIGLVLQSYIVGGLGGAVLNAAATTGIVTVAAGGYGYTTKRDLSGLGAILFVGLIAVVVASLIGIFVQMPLFHLILSIAAALLFTGFLVFDLNRVAKAENPTEGQTILLAVSIYLDIINLFLALLRIFGIGGSSDD